LKEQLEEAEVNISEAIRTALEEEIRRRRRESLSERAAEIEGGMERDEIAAIVREDRDNR